MEPEPKQGVSGKNDKEKIRSVGGQNRSRKAKRPLAGGTAITKLKIRKKGNIPPEKKPTVDEDLHPQC